jgi:hypothetical protein
MRVATVRRRSCGVQCASFFLASAMRSSIFSLALLQPWKPESSRRRQICDLRQPIHQGSIGQARSTERYEHDRFLCARPVTGLFVVYFIPAQLSDLVCPLAGQDQQFENDAVIVLQAGIPDRF